MAREYVFGRRKRKKRLLVKLPGKGKVSTESTSSSCAGSEGLADTESHGDSSDGTTGQGASCDLRPPTNAEDVMQQNPAPSFILDGRLFGRGEGGGEGGEEAAKAFADRVVMITWGELEKYVKQRVQESLAALEQSLLQPMAKKCDTLHLALERWRTKSFELQKQLDELICERMCMGARREPVSRRSVGVNVQMPPLKSQTSTPTSQRPLAASSTPPVNGSPMPTVGGLALTPAASGSTVLNRPSTQSMSGNGARGTPITTQLNTSSASPAFQQVKSVSTPVSASGSNTARRSTSTTSTPTSAVRTSEGIRVIDLTEEEDANLASTSSGSVGTVQEITVPSSGIPVPSAASTPLDQLSLVTRNVGAPMEVSAGSVEINEPVVAHQQATHLPPNSAPNVVVVEQREVAPRVSTPPRHVPTTLLHVTSSSNSLTTVHDSTISVGDLATQPGGANSSDLMLVPLNTRVRTIQAPLPVALQNGVSTFTLPPGTTVVRAPVTLPSGTSTTLTHLATEPSQQVILTSADEVTTAVGRHPAPLPLVPRYADDPEKKRLPPKPALRVAKVATGIALSWNMTLNSLYAAVQTYQLFVYQETELLPSTSLWRKMGDVRAMPLPMACTLTQFTGGHRHHFAIRAVDVYNRLGPFSDPSSILLE